MNKTHKETPWMSTPQSSVISDDKIRDYSVSFNKKLENDFKEKLFEETFWENKPSMDWLKDK